MRECGVKVSVPIPDRLPDFNMLDGMLHNPG
jgi:hypothetical protein